MNALVRQSPDALNWDAGGECRMANVGCEFSIHLPKFFRVGQWKRFGNSAKCSYQRNMMVMPPRKFKRARRMRMMERPRGRFMVEKCSNYLSLFRVYQILMKGQNCGDEQSRSFSTNQCSITSRISAIVSMFHSMGFVDGLTRRSNSKMALSTRSWRKSSLFENSLMQ